MTEMKRLDFECEFKFDEESGAIEGYGSMFNLVDRGGDVVAPGAFKASLANWKKQKSAPVMLWQHDSYSPIGVWTELEEDDKGLKVKGQLVLEVPLAVAARALIKAKAVRGLSIGYRTLDYDIDRTTGIRTLKKVELWEISPVTFPMLTQAQITNVKGEFDARAFERALRVEGLSEREAKLACSVARKLDLRDGGQDERAARDGSAELLMSLRKAAAALEA
jgi:HK97 family phage prohead protease